MEITLCGWTNLEAKKKKENNYYTNFIRIFYANKEKILL